MTSTVAAPPDVELHLIERKTTGQLDAMREGTQDLGLIHRPAGQLLTGFGVATSS